MKVADKISKETKQQMNKLRSPKVEKLSERDIKELMGQNMPTYGRNRHGAISNKRNG